MQISPAPFYPNEQDGFTNHEARLCVDAPIPEGMSGNTQVYNRVVVIAPDIETVRDLQKLLPEFLQRLEPISLIEAMTNGIRPEPNRLLQITREDVNVIRDQRRGKMFFLAYAIFEFINSYGHWVDLRDQTSCKWGRRPVPHAPGNTLSEQIFRGETTIAQVKANCGFQ